MRTVLILTISFALLAPAAGAMDMAMSSPEHVSEALAALQAHHDATARTRLREATKTKAEPKAARERAAEALQALLAGMRGQAVAHATEGAAVEHLSYALAAVEAKHDAEARGHLREAAMLAPVAKQAKAAIAALHRHDRPAAVRAIRAGLKKVGG